MMRPAAPFTTREHSVSRHPADLPTSKTLFARCPAVGQGALRPHLSSPLLSAELVTRTGPSTSAQATVKRLTLPPSPSVVGAFSPR